MAKQTTNNVELTKSVEQRSVDNFLSLELKEFAFYVIQTRAFPNMMDGLRTGSRKIVYSLLINGYEKNGKISKLLDLVGSSMKLHYTHSGTSLENTIVQLGSTYVNQQAPIEIVGQIGDLRSPKCATASRYLNFKTSKWLDLYKYDLNLLEPMVDEGVEIEPPFFLPIIPLQLLYRTSSPGFGFSYKCFSYDLDNIIDCCLQVLYDGSCLLDDFQYDLKPNILGINPNNIIYNSTRNIWYNIGDYVLDFEKDRLIVTDLPYKITFEAYDKLMLVLIEKNLIQNYYDLSKDGKIRYVVQFSKGQLKRIYQDKWKFFKLFRLYAEIPKDILNCILEDGIKWIHFDNPYQLIDVFVEKRLKYYFIRKKRMIEDIEKKLKDLKEKMLFITLVVTNKIIINKRSQTEIKKDLDLYNIGYDVLKLTIGRLTKDEIDKLEKEIEELTQRLEDVKLTPEKTMYMQDLIELKEKFCEVNVIKI